MEFRTYDEFYTELSTLLNGWDVVLGTTKETLDRPTCFISHRGSTTTASDGQLMVLSSTYDLVFLQKRAAFTNVLVIEMMENGVRFSGYDDDTGMNIFQGSVTLFGTRSLPDE